MALPPQPVDTYSFGGKKNSLFLQLQNYLWLASLSNAAIILVVL